MANIVIGEVKLPTEEDFVYVKDFCENNDGWNLNYSKDNIKVYIKQNDLSAFEIMKIIVEFNDVSASVLYTMFQDEEYRYEWDKEMIEGYPICYIDMFCDIAYYSMKPPMLAKRDFVIQRSWKDYGEGQDKVVYNHSVDHAKYPPRKDAIRGISYLNSTLIKPTSEKSCILYSAAQADPGGIIPVSIVNFAIRFMAPSVIKRIHKSVLDYKKWKSKHKPEFQPWVNEWQIPCPKIDWKDVIIRDKSTIAKYVNIEKKSDNKINENQLAEKLKS